MIVLVIRILLLGLTIMAAADVCGYPVRAVLAGLGVIGLGIGFAMQGLFGNIIAGVTLIFTKPFRVGEYIEIAGVQGQVKTIELFVTVLTHSDMSRVVIPNKKIVGEVLHNYGHIRQLNLSVGVAYGTDLNNALTIARAVLAQNPRVLKDPEPSQTGDDGGDHIDLSGQIPGRNLVVTH